MKKGTLCFGSFEAGNATYWEVRCQELRGAKTWLVYRTSVAEVLIGEYRTPGEAYAEVDKHVPPRIDSMESIMGN